MLQVGDKVYIEDSAQIDVGFLAWEFVDKHRGATVRARMASLVNDPAVPESKVVYALEWDTEFSGGHYCQKTCADRRGQFIAGEHLSLCFEESRDVVTVPNIEPKA